MATVDSVDVSLWTSFFRVAVVLLLMAPLIYFSTRWYGRRHTGSGSVRILESVSLGPGKVLVVIEWRQNLLLLGVTGQAIRLLAQEAVDTNEGEEPH